MGDFQNKNRKDFLYTIIQKTVLKHLPNISPITLDIFANNVLDITLLTINGIPENSIRLYIHHKNIISSYDDNLNLINLDYNFDFKFWYKAVQEISNGLKEVMKGDASNE